jgi:antitoxin (DNA-binding transcriptional repressor) of toxin-antitoxin stability system
VKPDRRRSLDRVEKGGEIRRTRTGRLSARLAPEPTEADIRAVIAEIREFRKGHRLGDDLTIRQLIDEGRRF